MQNIYAQSWAPIGAEWHYESQRMFANEKRYFRFGSTKDTVILGKNCKEITAYNSYSCLNRSLYPIFTYQSNDSVFFLNYVDSGNPTFQMHFNWSAGIGDSWLMAGLGARWYPPNYYDSIIVQVDSLANIDINGILLRRLFVNLLELDSTLAGHGDYIEGIGDTYYKFGTEHESGMCEEDFPIGLRCYQDINIGLFMPIFSDSCNQWKDYTSVEKISNNINVFEFFPNPAQDNLFFTFCDKEFDIQIFDQNGKSIFTKQMIRNNSIDISMLKSGLYLLQARFYEGDTINFKFIKK